MDEIIIKYYSNNCLFNRINNIFEYLYKLSILNEEFIFKLRNLINYLK